MAVRVAAVDCGTNALRLLVADVDPGRAWLTDVTRRMEIVRLGQGVDKTGLLAPEALARVLADGGHPLRGGLPGERQPLQPPQPPRRDPRRNHGQH